MNADREDSSTLFHTTSGLVSRRPSSPGFLSLVPARGRASRPRSLCALLLVSCGSAACSRHRKELADFCGRCFGRAGFRFHCVEGRARLICSACSTIVTRPEFGATDPAKIDFLLALSAEISAAIDVDVSSGSHRRDEIARAARLLWAPSQANGKPFILWLDPALPSGWSGRPLGRRVPLATATLPWRAVTLIGVAQLLDFAGARQRFGPPPPFLLAMFARLDADVIPGRRRGTNPLMAGSIQRSRSPCDPIWNIVPWPRRS
jgi:hypothetical protein